MSRAATVLAACALAVTPAFAGLAGRADAAAGTRAGHPPRATPRTRRDAPGSSVAPAYGVGVLTIAYTDTTRTLTVARRPAPRTVVTVIRYPTAAGGGTEVRGAAPAQGPFPLIVFAHGFDSMPVRYAHLLDAWTQAGYVVAAPIFPRTSARAAGGPDEADLVNQPADMRLVITRTLSLDTSGRGILRGLVDTAHIAVAGQSDGGSTALATAIDRATYDSRISAAVVLSGARIAGFPGYTYPSPTPPLLGVQGTADNSNAPASTRAWFRPAPPPKYLLWLWGAGHLPPYTGEQPQLGIVEAVTTAFLDRYLKGDTSALQRMVAAGNVAGLSDLSTRG